MSLTSNSHKNFWDLTQSSEISHFTSLWLELPVMVAKSSDLSGTCKTVILPSLKLIYHKLTAIKTTVTCVFLLLSEKHVSKKCFENLSFLH